MADESIVPAEPELALLGQFELLLVQSDMLIFHFFGTDMRNLREFSPGLRKLQDLLNPYNVGVHPMFHAFRCEPGIATELDTLQAIAEDADAVMIGDLTFMIHGRGCDLPEGLIPRLLPQGETTDTGAA